MTVEQIKNNAIEKWKLKPKSKAYEKHMDGRTLGLCWILFLDGRIERGGRVNNRYFTLKGG